MRQLLAFSMEGYASSCFPSSPWWHDIHLLSCYKEHLGTCHHLSYHLHNGEPSPFPIEPLPGLGPRSFGTKKCCISLGLNTSPREWKKPGPKTLGPIHTLALCISSYSRLDHVLIVFFVLGFGEFETSARRFESIMEEDTPIEAKEDISEVSFRLTV